MSLKKNQELSSWKAVLVRLRRVSTAWQGTPLSKGDHQTFTEAVLLQVMMVADLSNQYDGFGTHSDHVNLAMRMVQIDVAHLASFLSVAISRWRQCTSPDTYESVASYTDFKRLCGSEFPFAGELLSPASKAIQLHLETRTSATFYPVYQYLSFLSHLTLERLDIGDQLETEYLEQESKLQSHHLPDHFIDQMRAVMTDWMRDFKVLPSEFLPAHGPGGVSELRGDRSVVSKYRELRSDMLLDHVLRRYVGAEASDFFPQSGPLPLCFEVPEPVHVGQLDRTCRIVFVPKSMKTKRVISAEPTTLMYFQKAVDACVRKYMGGHHYLKSRIDLCDQDVQQEMALSASSTKDWATVDLSAASDSISVELVKEVFRDTALFPFLVALRSRSALLPSGRRVELKKFAPMGSALCFPVQTLIFACIVECTARYVRKDRDRPSGAAFRVYGDDIIVPEALLGDLMINLRWCGFRINREKTYGGNHEFRESCGCDAYDGGDVSPMRISRKFSAREVTSRNPGSFAGLVDLVNDCQVYSFPILRHYLVDKLVNEGSHVPFFSTDRRFGVASTSCTNYRLKRRFNVEYQRTEVQGTDVGAYHSESSPIHWDKISNRFVDDDLDPAISDFIRLHEWLRSTYYRTHGPLAPGAEVVIRIGTAVSYLSKRWFCDPPMG